MTPSIPTVALVRTLLGLLAVSWLLSAAGGVVWEPSACAASTAHQYRPTRCDQITHLELDFLNDATSPPAAFNVNAGAIGPGEAARFKVFAATDDIRFFADVTHEIESIRVRVRPEGAGDGGFVRYDTSANIPVLEYCPLRVSRVARLVVLDIEYQCKAPHVSYTTRFVLVILGSEQVEHTEGPNGIRIHGNENLRVISHGLDERIRQRYSVQGTIIAENLRDTDAGATRMAVVHLAGRGDHPENTVAGFVDIPPISGRGLVEVPIDLLFYPPRRVRPGSAIVVSDYCSR